MFISTGMKENSLSPHDMVPLVKKMLDIRVSVHLSRCESQRPLVGK